jgi:hypothetical protein
MVSQGAVCRGLCRDAVNCTVEFGANLTASLAKVMRAMREIVLRYARSRLTAALKIAKPLSTAQVNSAHAQITHRQRQHGPNSGSWFANLECDRRNSSLICPVNVSKCASSCHLVK